MSYFTIAALQLDLDMGDNFARIEREISTVMVRFPFVQMVVLSELSPLGPLASTAQALPGAAENRLQAIAKKHEIWLAGGSLYERSGEKIYNTATVFDPDGKIVGRYRKMFPFAPYERGISPGSEFLVFDVPGIGRFGLSICYDMWFPETSRTLAWMGAEVILHPTLTNTIDRDVELAIARATAATNQCYFIDVNGTGQLGFGRSTVVGPEGDVIYQAGSGSEIIPVEIDFNRVRRCRERGVLGLGQPLKSFRDASITFPPYSDHSASLALRHLGPLEKPSSMG